MAIDPKLYELDRIDDAFHGQPPPHGFEWWYFDAIFDNGYSMVTSWHIGEMETANLEYRLIVFSIYDPDGKKTDAGVEFPASAVFASTETCDVKMGDNHLHGEFPRHEIHFRSGDMGADLIFENLTQGIRPPPDGVMHFGREPDKYLGWAIAQPRARVAGKLILAGEEIPVNGVGYHDHNWGKVPLQELLEHWYWGRLFLPDHTVIYAVGRMPESLGYEKMAMLIAIKGEKLLQWSSHINAEPSGLEVDELTGTKYPRKLVLKMDDSRINGEVILRLRKLIESPEPPRASEGHGYFRFLSDCDVKLDVDGEKIEVEMPLVHELAIP
ncbi:MAG: hypothetical protein KAX23_05605 [Dehalococcoidia bacterium]|jgi:hypothetical protein|nr:hypothetical protein [Dehalococcoidia bacterium]